MIRATALLLALTTLPTGAALASDTANGKSAATAISADGRYVAFVSTATDLTPDAPLGGSQIFLYDRETGASTRVGGEVSDLGFAISADGRFVAFTSYASNLFPGQEDIPSTLDVFLWDRVTGETELVSRAAGARTKAADGPSFSPAVSADGRFVAFGSVATDLVDVEDRKPSYYNDIYLWDRSTGNILPVSRSAKETRRMADGGSGLPSISADGRFVAFLSEATDLVAGQRDRNRAMDVFLWDRATRASVLVSRSAGNPLAAGNSGVWVTARISADGGSVAFTSGASNLVSGQRGGGVNVFLWRRATGQVTLVSHKAGSMVTGAGNCHLGLTPFLSADGSWVAYASYAQDLTSPRDPNSGSDAFLWSRATGQNTRVSRADAPAAGSLPTGLSADGAWLVYESTGRRQAPGTLDRNRKNDAFLYERRTGAVTLLSFSASSTLEVASGESTAPLLSANGRWIVFTSDAADLSSFVLDDNGSPDVVLQSRNGDRQIVSIHAAELP